MTITELDEHDGLLFYINSTNYKHGFNITNMYHWISSFLHDPVKYKLRIIWSIFRFHLRYSSCFCVSATPFKFNASLNNTLNGSMSAKKSFDLQASLARPITWKAHKGKLKPLNSQTAFSNGSHTSVKTPSTQTR